MVFNRLASGGHQQLAIFLPASWNSKCGRRWRRHRGFPCGMSPGK